MTTALIVVDVQNDFCEGGSLPVAGGFKVADDIAEHLSVVEDRLIVFTYDFHLPESDNGGHIAIPPAEPDYVDVWPAHCIQGTNGAGLADAITAAQSSLMLPFVEVYKGQGVPAYSGFQGTTNAGKSLADLLHEQGVEHVEVCGLAADYCVRATALDAISEGFRTSVLGDLTASINTPVADVVSEIEDRS